MMKKFAGDWVLVSDGLPPEPDGEESLFDDFLGEEYIVFVDGATKAMSATYIGKGHWYSGGEFYRVYAWAEFPDVADVI